MRKWLAILMTLVFMAASLVGCGSKEPPATTNPPATTQTQTGNDLAALMKSAGAVKNMSVDMITNMTSQGQTVTSTTKFYMSEGKMRMESEAAGVKSIMITKSPQETYVYNPETKTAMKISNPEEAADLPSEWIDASGDTTGYQVIAEEKMDGYDCLVVQYTDPSAATNTVKMWMRKDNGLPVRVEAKIGESSVITDYKNYNLGAPDPSLFELPAGTQIVTLPTMPGMPNLPQ